MHPPPRSAPDKAVSKESPSGCPVARYLLQTGVMSPVSLGRSTDLQEPRSAQPASVEFIMSAAVPASGVENTTYFLTCHTWKSS